MKRIFSIGLLALFAGLSALGTTSAQAAPLHAQSSSCYRWPKADVHIYGPGTVTNSTDYNYSIVITNKGCKTLKNLNVRFTPSSIVASSQPSGLNTGKIALPNLRSGKTRTVKMVLNYPSSWAGREPTIEAEVYSGRNGVSVASRVIHVS